MTDATLDGWRLLELTAAIVSAHVSNNHVPAAEVADVIQIVFDKLSSLAEALEEKVELVLSSWRP